MKLVRVMLFVYAISTGFTHLWNLPFFGKKVQPPEFIFLALFLLWSIQALKGNIVLRKINKLEIAFLLFILAEIASAFHTNMLTSWFEVAGTLYLVLVYFIVKTTLLHSPDVDQKIYRTVVVTGLTLSVLGISGWLLEQFNIHTKLSLPTSDDYPYLGHIGRARAFLFSPNMLHNFLSICFLWILDSYLQTKTKRITQILVLVVIGIGILVCFSKTTLLLIISALYLIYKQGTYPMLSRQFIIYTSVFLFVTCMIGTHFMILNTSSSIWQQRENQSYFDPVPVWTSGSYIIVPTCYTVLKRSAFMAGKENPVFGVGPGGHNAYAAKLKKEGRYPEHIQDYDPHSTYLGAFAESGLPGLLVILWIGICLWQSLNRSIQDSTAIHMRAVLQASFLFMAMEAINMDILNFRHLWILIGILGMYEVAYNGKKAKGIEQ